jgi:hypothetical protein
MAEPRPTREQVKVWLATVLWPIVRGLTIEADYVARRNWSFRAHSRDFEFLSEIEQMVTPIFGPNLRQFYRFHRDALEVATAHDLGIKGLREACRDTFDALWMDEDFQALTAPIPENERAYYAEYVVNGIVELPSHYTAAPIWNAKRQSFRGLRDKAQLRDSFMRVEQEGQSMRALVERALDELSTIRDALADDHGLPPVDPVDAHLR